jgi:hypothetical protein
MRLTDLLDHPVLDVDGRPMGRVREVRLVQDGSLVPGFGAGLRVDGLLVGKPAAAVRLGFHRPDVRGPWPLKPVLAFLASRATYVAWEDLSLAEDGTISCSAVPS